MLDLVQRFTTEPSDANELRVDESAEYDLCVCPLDASFDFFDGAVGFLFIGRPYGRWRIRDRLETNFPECSSVGCSQWPYF
jgi:hypothetical protein